MIVTKAPFRVSFFGGGTDHPEFFLDEGGIVLGSSINKYCYTTLNPLESNFFDYNLKVSYSKIEFANNVLDIEHNIFRECLRYFNVKQGLSIHNVFDLPSFSGLGSSSSLTVSFINALEEHFGIPHNSFELAKKAIHVERNLVKSAVGWQDQIFAACGGFNLIRFNKNETFTVEPITLDTEFLQEFEDHLFLVYTGIQRESSLIIQAQINRININRQKLLQIKEIALHGYNLLLSASDLSEFGKLLHESWLLKRSFDKNVSTPEMDELYNIALSNGAFGGKILGAGGGGFFLFFADPRSQEKIKNALPSIKCIKIKTSLNGSRSIFKS
ncbi:COG2605 Predicted kinase related to galactokinase and mevalonate kinase [Candidatus Methylopumilus universalis]|uniref:GHMP family kinase ATP-binding protein n=1 Tax=Candidatus Methylopumilus universalis TaxID=2588536 RepID=UPI003BEF494E